MLESPAGRAHHSEQTPLTIPHTVSGRTLVHRPPVNLFSVNEQVAVRVRHLSLKSLFSELLD